MKKVFDIECNAFYGVSESHLRGVLKMRRRSGSLRMVEEPVRVTLFLERDLVDRIDRIADKVKMSRSRLARNFMEMGLDDAEVLDMVGVLSLVMKIEGMREKKRSDGLSEAVPA